MSISNSCLYSCHLKSNVCHQTYARCHRFTYQYTIYNFQPQNPKTKLLISSPVFYSEDSSWTVIVGFFKNIKDNNEYMGLLLNRESGEKPVLAKYTFSLINFQNNERTQSKTNSYFYSQRNSIYFETFCSENIQLTNENFSGFMSFIAKDLLLDSNNNLIRNNKITICCDIYLFIINDCNHMDRYDTNLSINYSTLLKEGKHSEIFDSKMLSNKENLIRIKDMSEEVICHPNIPLYISEYSGKVSNLSKVAENVLYAKDKHKLSQVSQLCESQLLSDLTVDTAPQVLVLSHLFKAVNLKAVVIDFIITNRKEGQKSNNWDLICNHSDLMNELFSTLFKQIVEIKLKFDNK